MKRKFLTVRGGIAALFAILLCTCLALGVWLTMPRSVYAEESAGQVEQIEDNNERAGGVTALAEPAKNDWLVSPAVLSWKYDEYDPNVKVINAVPLFGKDKMNVFIFSLTDDGNSSITHLNFKLGADCSIPQDASEILAELEAGEYYMLVTVPGTDEYTSLNEIGVSNPYDIAEFIKENGVKFNVFQVNNNWRTTPNVIQWTWGNYDRYKNLITAVPAYPQNPADAVVKFGVYTDPECYDSSVVEGLEEFSAPAGIVESSVARILSGLDAGTYYLYATSEGGTSYTELKSIVQFSVQSIQNNWAVTPYVVQWTWGSYDREINAIMAEPVNGAIENLVFGIYSDANCNEKVSEQFSFKKQVEQVYDEDGSLSFKISYVFEESVYNLLNDLSAGTYYLKAELAADENGNYSRLSAVVSFSVQSVQNNWSTTPSVLAWKYGEYDKSVNLIQAVPALGGAATITVYHDDGQPVYFDNDGIIISSFTLESVDGALTVPSYVESVLKNLNVGTYYMLASVPADSNGNFSGLNNYTSVEDIKAHGIEFAVTPVQNGWVEIPKILSWSEGHYDKEVNKIIAEARNGNDKMIIYVIDSDDRIITSNAGGNELDYEAIENLSVGSYTIRFEIRGTGNYTSLEGETTFAVFEDSVGLTGIIAAVIVFGIFDVFAAVICIILLIFRRKKIEAAYRTMIRKELHRR